VYSISRINSLCIASPLWFSSESGCNQYEKIMSQGFRTIYNSFGVSTFDANSSRGADVPGGGCGSPRRARGE
jgi:hypothetical protein